MSVLSSLQDPILPIFMVMLIGFVMRRVGFFEVSSAQGINRFVFYIALPALMFELVRSIPLRTFDWTTVNLYLLSEFVVYGGVAWISYRWLKRPLGEALLLGMAAGFVNHVMFVLPIGKSLYGIQATEPIAAIVFVDIVVFCLSILMMDFIKAHESKQPGAFKIQKVGLMLIKNPMVVASVLGLIASSGSSYIPTGVFTYTQFVSVAAPPAALFALGVILGNQPLRPVGAATWFVVVTKIVVHPAMFFGLASLVALTPDWQTMAFLVAAGPCGAMPFVIALQYGVKSDSIAKAVLISTVFSLISLSVLTAS